MMLCFKHLWNQLINDCRGSVALEFALTIPLVLGAITISVALIGHSLLYNSVQAAIMDTGRWVWANPDVTVGQIETRLRDLIPQGDGAATVSVSTEPGDVMPLLTIDVSYGLPAVFADMGLPEDLLTISGETTIPFGE